MLLLSLRWAHRTLRLLLPSSLLLLLLLLLVLLLLLLLVLLLLMLMLLQLLLTLLLLMLLLLMLPLPLFQLLLLLLQLWRVRRHLYGALEYGCRLMRRLHTPAAPAGTRQHAGPAAIVPHQEAR